MWCVIIAVCHQGNISACENPFLNIYSSVLTKTRCVTYCCIQIRKYIFFKERFVFNKLLLSESDRIPCPATDASNNETWSLHIWSCDLLRNRDTSIYIKTDTQLWETETAVVNDIIQTLCFVYYCVLERHFLSFTVNWHITTLTFSHANVVWTGNGQLWIFFLSTTCIISKWYLSDISSYIQA